METVVKIDSGLIRGEKRDGLFVFKGIPYASPPVGQLRWQPPRPPVPWEGTKECMNFGPGCPQLESPTGHGIPWDRTDEDCLSLNIWTPAASSSDRLPVMVWIHGGAFVSGGSSFYLYDGANLSKKGVVVVTINYRLGPFGFLFGNFGLMDQIAALKWVKKNISALGGDADRTTIFGESAGAYCILRLMTSPLTEGLFQRAIIESGGHFGDRFWYPSPTTANRSEQKAVKKIADALGCGQSGEVIECLRQRSAKEILEAANPGIAFHAGKTPFGPTGPVGALRDIPLIIGSNADEGNMFLQKMSPVLRPLLNRVFTYTNFSRPAAQIVRDREKKGISTYLYMFCRIPPTRPGKKLGSHHGAEINYVFGNLDPAEGFGDGDIALSGSIMNYWTNFAATANPNREGLPVWPEKLQFVFR
ncbi:MAG: carboxylesterase family protein [Candidatus Margulisbacteria bacterium]|nr:carboxylesterase family protein [Candidatus Margulisiibacteriota bacterium]